MHDYDKSSKWLIQHHGAAILRLAGVEGIVEWRPLQAEVVMPRYLPDGLIAATLAGEPAPRLFVLELATYPEPRVADQAVRDAAFVYLDRGVVPEVFVVVLSPKGRFRVPREVEVPSAGGTTALHVRWHVVELWTIPADDLLAVPEVGAVPWALLGRVDGPPEPFFRRCRERIDREAAPEERESLLAVSQVLARLRYDDEELFRLLGGERTMLELPFLDTLKEKWMKEAAEEAAREATRKATHDNQVRNIVDVLTARFGSRASTLRPKLDAIGDEGRLNDLVKVAAVCESLKDFRAHLREAAGEGKAR
ncbi:hypothetical protein OJF2_05050 [Aquisphaera giovannonii]|uniref:DUF4351 domain-containing protein n=1 Tax=Aquisphaera giovannonii TaxID=406548 RepID=A0A5B9VU13_9BACT|nr:hypothetical protein [Aquisphaera giovannonii]QEH32036.1 hypothetical protein OJF2_05050 [Aquisphaera giovannonii]